jgi:MoaA/NifB/PqqE/SkfB family radical SAM enzyme
MEQLRNFTAILPVTCNANCVFCPEKEMEKKASKQSWLSNLVTSIKKVSHVIDHVSLSGGEPTLNLKLLHSTVDNILKLTPIKRVGITTNGQFLESANKTMAVLNTLIDPTTLKCKLDFMNVSLHSFDADTNMKIMGISSMYDINKLTQFRKILGVRSFHINFVVCEQNIHNIEWEMGQALELMLSNPHINVVFRVDYNQKKIFKSLHAYASSKKGKVAKPQLLKMFDKVFAQQGDVDSKAPEMDYCPSCFTKSVKLSNKNRAYLKASAYEPNAILKKITEVVFHQDGIAYSDWSRKELFNFTDYTKQYKVPANRMRDSTERLSVKKVHGVRCGYVGGSSCGY